MAKTDINVSIVITLTEDEAIALRDVLARVSGIPGTRRELVDAITQSLDGVGIEVDSDSIAEDIEGEVRFYHVEEDK